MKARALRGGDRLASAARKLAREKTIDLPGAYSILLGIMSLQDVREFAGGRKKKQARPSARGRYDPAFAEAVEKGYLSARQAIERGQREVYATELTQRRGLPKSLAYAVADNRMSLLEALRESDKAGADDSVQVKLPGGIPLAPILVAGVAMALVVVAILALRPPSEAVTAQLTTNLGEATVVTDGDGRVLRVAGPNPKSVLRAYCRVADDEQTLEEISVIPASSRMGRARLGLLRRPSDPGTLLSILIEADREQGVWFVGNGTSLIVPDAAPPGAEQQVTPQPAAPSSQPVDG